MNRLQPEAEAAMIVRFVCIVCIAWILAPAFLPAADHAPSPPRWGITTKKDLEVSRETAPGKTAVESGVKPHGPTADPIDEASRSSDTPGGDEMIPKSGHGADRSNHPLQKSDGDPPHEKTSPPDRQPSTADAPTQPLSPAIEWSSEDQEARCGRYLEDLRALFLRTRHYSIQGAACDTAQNAAAFLASVDTCERECPPEFLAYSGYTDRIIRNIRYLEKLGHDRCTGSLSPHPPATTSP